MHSNDCDLFMDEIDRGEGNFITENMDEHLKRCPECRAYVKISEYLRSLDGSEEKIDLWNEFRARLENREKSAVWMAPAFACLSFFLILLFFSIFSNFNPIAVKKINTGVSTSSSSIQAEFSGDNTELDCYYEISMDI